MSTAATRQEDELAEQMVASSISGEKNDEHNNYHENAVRSVGGCVKYC